MKLKFLFLILLFSVVKTQAQNNDWLHSDYVSIGSHVNIRTGPGKNYNVVLTEYGEKIQLDKNEGIITYYNDNPAVTTYNSFVFSEGQKRNGFIKIRRYLMGHETIGWVSAQYLRPVCPSCKGVKYYRSMMTERRYNICKRCKGKGYR